MVNLRYFPILIGIVLIVVGCILCPPSFWDSIFLPLGMELPSFEIVPLNCVGFGLTVVGLIALVVAFLRFRLSLRGSTPSP